MAERFTKDERDTILWLMEVARDAVNATTESEIPSAEGLDPDLLPSTFTPPGNLDVNKLKDFSFTQAQVDEVMARVENAIETQNRVKQFSARAIQVLNTLKPLIPMLMAL